MSVMGKHIFRIYIEQISNISVLLKVYTMNKACVYVINT